MGYVVGQRGVDAIGDQSGVNVVEFEQRQVIVFLMLFAQVAVDGGVSRFFYHEFVVF